MPTLKASVVSNDIKVFSVITHDRTFSSQFDREILTYCSKIKKNYRCKTNDRNLISNQIGISYLSFSIKLFRTLSFRHSQENKNLAVISFLPNQ